MKSRKKLDKEELHRVFARLRAGNEDAFTVLYEKYHSLVYAIAFSILKNGQDSEEIVQKVFLKIWKMDKEKLPTKNEASWLYSVTKNETINFVKNDKKEMNIEEAYYISDEGKELNGIVERDAYNRMIAKLSVQEQEIVSLKVLSNLSFKQISQILDIPMGTVKWKYYKSIHTLRLLFGNLSMFLVTISLWIVRKTKDRKKEANFEDLQETEESVKQPEKEMSKIEQDGAENQRGELENEIEEPIESVEIQERDIMELEPIDMGMLSVASIFLLVTITFFIIFINHQQKAKKKCLNNKKVK